MKRHISKILIIMGLLLLISNFAFAENISNKQIALFINGKIFEFYDSTNGPIIVNDTTMVPIRLVSEKLGFQVDWSQDTWNEGEMKVWVKRDETTIELEIGQTHALVNGKKVAISEKGNIKTMLREGTTYLPLRFIAENMNCLVDWSDWNIGLNIYIVSNNGEMLELVNMEREKAGVEPLTLSPELSKMATLKSQDMIDNNYYGHVSPIYGGPDQLLTTHGIRWNMVAENIVKPAPSADIAMRTWMNSPGHKANILNPGLKQIGIGLASDKGNIYWTQIFTD